MSEQTPTENNDPRHAAIGNLSFLMSVIRCGEQLSADEEACIRKTIARLEHDMQTSSPSGAGTIRERLLALQAKWRDISSRPQRPTGFGICADELDALIAALPLDGSEAQGWQPIETAPKDGTWILAVRSEGRPSHQTIVRWDHVDWPDNWSDGEYTFCPTHWMPLPAPPTPRASEPSR